MCWNSLGVVVYSVVFCALLEFGPSMVMADEPRYEGNTTVKEGNPFKITCRVPMFQVITWQKDDHTLVSDENFNISVAVTNDSMFVSTIMANSASSSVHSGAYRCTTQYNKFHELKVVTVKTKLKLPKTATFVEGEKMELECIVYGEPIPEVSWKYENTNLVPTEHIKFIPNKNNVTNGMLVFDTITMQNRGSFYCSGKNNYGFTNDSNPCYVRIRDKMAALWPFLCICAEVIILCLIIFIYEKKRNMAEFEESDTDQGSNT